MTKCLIEQSPKEQLMSLVPVWQAWLLPLLSPGAVDPCALFKRSSLVLVLQLGQETFSPTFSSTSQNVLELPIYLASVMSGPRLDSLLETT